MSDFLRFIHLSDSHIGITPDWDSFGQNALNNTRAIVDYINNDLPFTPDLVLHTGDVVYNPDPAAYPIAQEVLQDVKYPIYYARGNHDLPTPMRKYLSDVPDGPVDKLDYDFKIKDFHFIVFDSHDTMTHGILSDKQLAWIEKKLAESDARSFVIVTHHCPVELHVPVYDEMMMIKNHDALFDVLRPYSDRIRGLFYGHTHRSSITQRDGIICSCAPAIWFQIYAWADDEMKFRGDATAQPGFNVVTMTHRETVITHHTIPQP